MVDVGKICNTLSVWDVWNIFDGSESNHPGRRNICVAHQKKSWQTQRMGNS